MRADGLGRRAQQRLERLHPRRRPIAVAPQTGTFTREYGGDQYDCGTPTCRSAHEACVETPTNPALACSQNDDLYRCSTGGPNNVTGSCYSPGADLRQQ